MKTSRVIYFLLVLLVVGLAARSFITSLFITAPQRLQVVVYGRNTRVYSLDTQGGNTHYLIQFAPDEKVGVPGGYNLYRVGSLGKLVSLEKKPELFERSFSLATSSFVTYYFYPAGGDLYYGNTIQKGVTAPTFRELFSNLSNANIFDRLYLFFRFLQAKRSDYLLLRSKGDSEMKNGARIFIPETFSKQFEGYIYNPAYRHERQTVQIIYTKSYTAARDIGNMLEGNGIRVVDIKKGEKTDSKCLISETEPSQTAQAMSSFFKCEKRTGKNEVSDILFDIRSIEKDWEIQ